MALAPAQARDMALELLVHLAERPDLLEEFLAASGLPAQDLRRVAQDPGIALALLDFIVENDRRLLECAAALGVPPQQLMAARTALAGPGSYGWSVD